MTQKLITALEFVLIVGLMALVMYWGGLFNPTPPSPTTSPSPTSTGVPLNAPTGLIAFSTDRDGNFEVYVMNADGSHQHNLTRAPGHDLYPIWSPDGTRIAFISDRAGWWDVYVMDASGFGVEQLTRAELFNVTYAGLAWSPDGAQLIATRADGQQNLVQGIRAPFAVDLIQSDGSGVTPVYPDLQAGFVPMWSPDGGRLAVVRYMSDADQAGSVLETLVIDPRAPGEAKVTGRIPRCVLAGWLPAGDQVLCHMDGALKRFNTDGTGERFVVELMDASAGVVLSPDGKSLLYPNGTTVVEKNKTLQELRWIRFSPPQEPVVLRIPLENAAVEPIWAPDNQWVAYGAPEDTGTNILIVNVNDSSSLRHLTDDAGQNILASWQPAPKP